MKPNDLYLGVVELFSVFIPGLITLYLINDNTLNLFSGDTAIITKLIDGKIDTTLEYIAFSIIAYIIGHILFAVGAVLWDELYDCIKDRNEPPKDRKPCRFYKISYLYYPGSLQKLIDLVDKIRQDKVSQTQINQENIDNDKLNNYQWSRSVVSQLHPIAFQEVLRKEADSKLFRSLLLPILILGILQFSKTSPGTGLITLLFFYLAYMRYSKQRLKGCKIAYSNVITLHHLGKLAPPKKK